MSKMGGDAKKYFQSTHYPPPDLRVPLSPSSWLVRMTANHGNQNGDDKRSAEIKVGRKKLLFRQEAGRCHQKCCIFNIDEAVCNISFPHTTKDKYLSLALIFTFFWIFL